MDSLQSKHESSKNLQFSAEDWGTRQEHWREARLGQQFKGFNIKKSRIQQRQQDAS